MRLHRSFQMLRAQGKSGSLTAEVAAHYFASALLGVIVWWVEKDLPCTVAEIDQLFIELAMPGFRQSD